MPDPLPAPVGPDRAAREAAVRALRVRAEMDTRLAARWRKHHALAPGEGYAGEADTCAARATRLEQVAVWLEGMKDD